MNLSPVSWIDKELGAGGIHKKQEQDFTYQAQERILLIKPKQSTHIKNRSSKANK